jgi:hypothetical protein
MHDQRGPGHLRRAPGLGGSAAAGTPGRTDRSVARGPLRVGYRLAPAFPWRVAAGSGAGTRNGWNGRSPGQPPGS